MSWRVIYISEPCKLRLQDNSLIIEKEKIHRVSNNVLPNDSGHVEGYAAAYYFSVLYKNFKRDTEALVDVRNAAINYGYALIRSNIVRSISAVGLLPVFGIKHDSELNPFNLADDLIEPFRPFVDKIVFELFAGIDTDKFLEKSDKVELLGIFSQKFLVDNKQQFLSNAIEVECESLVNVLFGNTKRLLLPEFV